MTKPRVLVVEHQRNAGSGLVGERLVAHGFELCTVGPEIGIPLPNSIEGYDALIVLGGEVGPTDDDRAPWLPTTRSLLNQAVQQEVPTLGICLGAQLLVTAAGGRVTEMTDGPEVGLCTLEFTGNAALDPVFGALAGETVPAVQWHWLEAESLPEGATVLASSAACKNQVFRLGTNAWGVQFHPEALGQTAADWVEEDSESLEMLGMIDTDLVGRVRTAETELTDVWGSVADRFAGLVLGASPGAKI